MRVKEAVITFVAMGGFAVPVIFQTPESSSSPANPSDLAAQTTGPSDDKTVKKV